MTSHRLVRHAKAGIALFLAAMFTAPAANAHAVGTSYIAIDERTNTIDAGVEVTLRDLEFAIGLDSNADGQVTWGEVKGKFPALIDYVMGRITVGRGGKSCALTTPDLAINKRAEEIYGVLTFGVVCAAEGALSVTSNLMFDLDDSHRSLLTVNSGGVKAVSILTAGSRGFTVSRERFAVLKDIARFVAQGVWHIWIGFDHLAFLMLLLLPLTRAAGSNEGDSLPVSVGKIMRVVTAFTAAHSLTLVCAALGYVNLPSRWTEAAIAASIVIAAIANLTSRTAKFGVAMAFGFGLIHGLGFASALADIATNTTNRVLPLVGFNLGVEIGQLAIVLAVFPFLFLRATSPLFKQRTAIVGSAAMGALGVAWLVQRTIL